MDTHWKKKFKALGPVADRVARGLFVAVLLVLTLGPLPLLKGDVPTASADLLKWDDMRPVYTDSRDTTATYVALPTFGTGAAVGVLTSYHPVVVAPNGDLFTAGDSAGGNRVYKSTDGGLTWQANKDRDEAIAATTTSLSGDPTNPFAIAGSTITGIAVAPKYPTDNVVMVVFTDGLVDTAGGNSLAISTDGGDTFHAIRTQLEDVRLTALAVASATRAFVGDSEGFVWSSTDAGATWTRSVSDLGFRVVELSVSPDFSADGTLYASSDSATTEIYVSHDGGDTWTPQGSCLDASCRVPHVPYTNSVGMTGQTSGFNGRVGASKPVAAVQINMCMQAAYFPFEDSGGLPCVLDLNRQYGRLKE